MNKVIPKIPSTLNSSDFTVKHNSFPNKVLQPTVKCGARVLSCVRLCEPMDSRQSGSSVHGLFQARILEQTVLPPPVDLPNPGIKPKSPVSLALSGRFFTTEPPGKALLVNNSMPNKACSLTSNNIQMMDS